MFYPSYDKKLTDFLTKQPSYAANLPAATTMPAAEPEADNPAPDIEIKKYFTFNQTGNIMISSTSPDGTTTPAVTEVFQKVVVFFGAITAAMAGKKKTLYDYTALQAVVEKSGLFIAMHQEDRDFSYSSHELTLDTAIITGILGAVSGGGPAMKIAQHTLASIGSAIKVSASSTSSDKKVGNLLFVCEDLMGMPIITIQLFEVDAKETETVAKSNCSTYVSTTVNFKYHQNTYLFVDPSYINQFAKEFEDNPEYKKLIEKLAASIPD